MRTKHKVRNLQEEQAPDCCTCAERNACERFAENSFCTKWHSRDPEKEGVDPNEAWKRGDDTSWN